MLLTHPYKNLPGANWLRGNLHAHTTRSDGACSQQQVIDEYAAQGYDFLMLSDHDLYTSPEDYAALDDRGLILISGNEVSADGVHMLHVHADRRVEPAINRQEVIDEIHSSGNGGFALVNHPNWYRDWDHCPQEKLEEWQGYAGIEIYNGVIGILEGSQYATDRWDRLLSKGRRVWGYAHDDSHALEEIGQGWDVAYAEPNVESIVAALREGRFYASTGVVIREIEVEGSRIRIETENADRIVATTSHQRRFAIVDEGRIEVDLEEYPTVNGYVRFECWGRGEQFAWTQPFFIEA